VRKLEDIKVGRYRDPQAVGFMGWIEPDDRSWVVFIDLLGRPVLFADRDPATGRVV
jgi:hypothetical protein